MNLRYIVILLITVYISYVFAVDLPPTATQRIDAFNGSPTETSLDLSNLKLTDEMVPEILDKINSPQGIERLRTLNLKQNEGITTLPIELGRCENLVELLVDVDNFEVSISPELMGWLLDKKRDLKIFVEYVRQPIEGEDVSTVLLSLLQGVIDTQLAFLSNFDETENASSVLNRAKHQPGPASVAYHLSMGSNQERRLGYIRGQIREYISELDPEKQITVGDFGGGSGDLALAILTEFGDRIKRYIYLDKCPLFCQAAKEKLSQFPNACVIEADALNLAQDLGIADGELDCLITASFLHELRCYSKTPYSLPHLVASMYKIIEKLNLDGIFVFKDPAQTPNPDEFVNLVLSETDGANPRSIETIKGHKEPWLLSTKALFRKFVYESPWIQKKYPEYEETGGEVIFHETPDGFVIKTRKHIVQEFLRQRLFTRDWKSETPEEYGWASTTDLQTLAHLLGLTIKDMQVKGHEDETYRSHGLYELFGEKDLDGKPRITITREDGTPLGPRAFPTNIMATMCPRTESLPCVPDSPKQGKVVVILYTGFLNVLRPLLLMRKREAPHQVK